MTTLADDPSLKTDEFVVRLAHRYRPGQWIGGLRKAFGATTEIDAEGDGNHEDVESHPPHYLAALWKPPALGTPFLPRWPFKVCIVAPDVAAALRDLLTEVPAIDRLWLTDQHIDWSLMANIVLLGEPGLRPFQRRGLQAMAQAERETTLAAIRLHYGSGDLRLESSPCKRPGVPE